MDTSKEYIKVIIVHTTVHLSFHLKMQCILNISYLYGKQIKSKLRNKLCINDFHLCILESA